MKKQALTSLLILLSCFLYGQQSKPFPYLTEITNATDTTFHLFVDQSKSEIVNKQLQELDPNHPLYASDGCESEMTLLALTPLDNTGRKYAIVFGYCPEPEFTFYEINKDANIIATVSGSSLYVPGNGSVYTSGHLNTNFDCRRKYHFSGGTIREVKQPYYYVGLKTKTLTSTILYKTKDLTEEVAKLPANYPIEVLLAETSYKEEDYYLIKTEFGLIGWAKVKARQYESFQIEGIFWNGD